MELNKKQTTTQQNEVSGQRGNNQPPQVGSGLAALFGRNAQQTGQATAAVPSRVEAGNVPGQQGLSGMLGNYRSMWQPNGGNNYQVIGGVQNII